jgi:hypothetical protein
MNPRELVDHIRSGPAELVLDKPLRFRRRTRSNPCDFNEFLQALQSSETIRTITCKSHIRLNITEDEWVLLVKTIGFISDIQKLKLFCYSPGSRIFRQLQAIADAVKNAHSLDDLTIGLDWGSFPRDPPDMIALANALQEHTTLRRFTWIDLCSRLDVSQITALDPVLRALPSCPHLREVDIITKCASTGAMNYLLQLQSTLVLLQLETDQWLAMTDEIRRGRCNVQNLILGLPNATRSEAAEAVQAIANAIQLDCNLKHLVLRMETGFTDEAGMALAKALTINTTLRTLNLCTTKERNSDSLGVQAYDALSAMLRVKTSFVLKLPPFKSSGADERLCESHDRLRIEQRLAQVGRGILVSSTYTTRKMWVNALCALNSLHVDDNADDSPAFQVSCLYSLLLLHPVVCMI